MGFVSELKIRRETDRALATQGAVARTVLEFDNIETLKRAIEINAGVALLPEPTLDREVKSGSLVSVRLGDDVLVRPLGIIYRRGKQLSTTTRWFMKLLTDPAEPASPVDEGRAVSSTNGGNGNGNAKQPLEVSGKQGGVNELRNPEETWVTCPE